ncbi:MAG: restriction endonuclease subunit S, partial [Nitrosomonadales bacterium]
MRGKLVPQDANDEPASELLKRIQAEKAKLIAEGKIKKDKPLAAITEDEKPFELPKGWEWVRFADLVNVLNGRAYKKEELIDAGTPVLRVGNLFTSEHWYYSDLILEEDKYCHKGDLLFAWSASFGPFIWDGDKAIYHYHIWKLDLYGGDLLYKRYLYTFLLEQTQKIKAAGHGVMMIHMTKEKMEKLVVYLPPIEEQHRIVAKVDELMALCDQLENKHSNAAEAHEKLVSHLLGTLTQLQNAEDFSANWQRIAAHFDTLFTTDASIDALKQTLLQLAVMGKLVPQDVNDEPASALLNRIQAEKAKLIAEGKIKKDKPLPPITDDEKPFEVPENWQWARLKDIVYLLGDGLHGTPVYTPNTECYFVNGNNLDNGRIIIKHETKTVSLEEMAKHRKNLNERTVLVSINGTIGNVAFYSNENIILGKSACYFNLADLIYKNYIKLLVESPYFIGYAFNSVSPRCQTSCRLKKFNFEVW